MLYTFAISAILPSLLIKPITTPPNKFITVTTIDIIESPLTNLEAPSIEPKKSASLCIFSLLILAVGSSISPELKSASIAICFPGIASSVNLAETSATRSEPFVITKN